LTPPPWRNEKLKVLSLSAPSIWKWWRKRLFVDNMLPEKSADKPVPGYREEPKREADIQD